MEIVIREYLDSDFDRVNKILKDNFDTDKSKNCKDDKVFEYVSQVDGMVVGYFVLTLVKNIVKGFDYYLLDYVCTDIDYQGKGIGKTMINYVVEKAISENVSYVQLTCSNKRSCAQHIYKLNGFERVDTNLFRRYF